MPVILANQKQINILNECNNSCYSPFKDEDETVKNETQQFLLQDIKNCMERCLCFLLIRVMKYIKCKPLPCLLVQSNLLINTDTDGAIESVFINRVFILTL